MFGVCFVEHRFTAPSQITYFNLSVFFFLHVVVSRDSYARVCELCGGFLTEMHGVHFFNAVAFSIIGGTFLEFQHGEVCMVHRSLS